MALNKQDFLLGLAIAIRFVAAWGAYWTVIRRIALERKELPVVLKGYNLKLIVSVFTFIVTCIGTSFFQACRAGWIPGCQENLILNEIALFNSLGLFAAYYVMHLLVNTTEKMKLARDNKNIAIMKKDVQETSETVKESAKDVKEVKKNVKYLKDRK